ncbi:hypothetical protein ACFFX0_32215 [Citricoccus parietis]|uniref:Uncharacterized protein n=1 Tax=Citricoccus parietis TaxID=592307 RepID=A0ABV5G9G1_9MICC
MESRATRALEFFRGDELRQAVKLAGSSGVPGGVRGLRGDPVIHTGIFMES